MTVPRVRPAAPSRTWASERLRARCATLLLVALCGALLSGCGLRHVAQRVGLPVGATEPRRSGFEARLYEIREQAALDPAQPYWPYRIAEVYLEADSAAQGEAALETALARDHGYAPALALLSRLYFDSGRHAQAISRLEAARLAPGGLPPALLAGLALHYDAIDRTQEARAAVSQIPRSERRDAGSALVYLTLRGERPDSATTLADAALDQDAKSAANHNNLGITRLRAGDPVAARRAFLKAIDLDPRRAGPYYNLAILEKYYLFDDRTAARWFKAYAQRSRQDPDSLFAVFLKGERPKLAGKEE